MKKAKLNRSTGIPAGKGANAPTAFIWRLLAIFLAALLLLTGCGGTTPPGPNSVGAVLEGTSYTFLDWEEGLRLLIWYDVTDSVQTQGAGSTDDPVHRQTGSAASADGRSVAWWLETSDGQTATFNLNGRFYDLSQGTLFLVRTEDGAVDVRQLNPDLSAVEPTVDGIESFGRADPDVSQFIRAAND